MKLRGNYIIFSFFSHSFESKLRCITIMILGRQLLTEGYLTEGYLYL